jgi:hypothetical protein
MKTTKLIKEKALKLIRKAHVTLSAPTEAQASLGLFIFGVAILSFGLVDAAQAGGSPGPSRITYNDTRIAEAIQAVLGYIEGTFGAMVMIAAGIGAIFSSAFGQYKAALGLLAVAVGAFILRSLVSAFFQVDDRIKGF